MQLNSSDGVSVELRINGYQFPDLGVVPRVVGQIPWADGRTLPVVFDDKWDPNWLQVCGRITLADGRAWAFEDPCLTTWEAQELGDWLRGVGAGTEQSFRAYGEPQGYLGFTEPNLGFKLEERTAGRVRITAEFTGEATPPWFRRGPERAPNSYFVRLDLSAGGIAKAAESWMHELAEFPER
jgi:hypothetical protein